MSDYSREQLKAHLMALGKRPNTIASSLLLLGIVGKQHAVHNPICNYLRMKEPTWDIHSVYCRISGVKGDECISVEFANGHYEWFMFTHEQNTRIFGSGETYPPDTDLKTMSMFLLRFYLDKYESLIDGS
jgi:hypothetical protein